MMTTRLASRHTDTQTSRHTDRQTSRQTDKKKNWQTDKQARRQHSLFSDQEYDWTDPRPQSDPRVEGHYDN